MNRLAEKAHQAPFSVSSKDDPDRTDYGQAIVKFCCEDVCGVVKSSK